jgi:DNA-binding NarL/FixJ family response regulator
MEAACTAFPESAVQPPEQSVGVMLVDNRTVMREGLRALIEQQPDLVVVAQAATVADAGSLDVTPDVIVTEVDLPDARQGDVVSGLRGFFPHSSILVLTLVGHPAKVQLVLAAGADGYLLKTAATADLFTGIRAVAGGETYLQPSLGVELARWHGPRDTALGLSPNEELDQGSRGLGSDLTAREHEMLQCMAAGLGNKQIAEQRELSLHTIRNHVQNVLTKLGAHSKLEAVAIAAREGLVDRAT